jgi:hypothetical protein
VPVLGLVDDLIFVPLAIAVVIRLVPPARSALLLQYRNGHETVTWAR